MIAKPLSDMEKVWSCSKDELETYLKKYKYYKLVTDTERVAPKLLTNELDAISKEELFTENTVLKVLLWKVHRYAELDEKLLNSLNALSHIQVAQREQARPMLEQLLQTEGVDLPMASTLLRFRNPAVFQIIDHRSFRVVMESDNYNLYSGSSVARKTDVYFGYLQAIDRLCIEKGINFNDADRILYEFDKAKNGALKDIPRKGWEDKFREMHDNGDDELIIPNVL